MQRYSVLKLQGNFQLVKCDRGYVNMWLWTRRQFTGSNGFSIDFLYSA